MQKLFLIDAYALIFRFHYAFVSRPMHSPDGQNISAVFGFVKFLNELIDREKPHHLGVAFDPRGGNFRHQLYPLYKANREETPEDIRRAVPLIKEILEAMKIPILEVAGYEADDVIGTLSHKASQRGEYETYMVTPDKDYGQLIRPNVFMYKPAKEGVEIVGCDDLCGVYGIANPRQIIDILAIWGDASDNIPGVPGIGEKGASKLVAQWGTVENILQNLDKLTPKQAKSIEENREQLELAKRLATISLDVPIEFDPERLVMEQPNVEQLREIYVRLNFQMFLRQLKSIDFHNNHSVQTDLFGNVVEQPTSVKPYSQIKEEEDIPTVKEIGFEDITTVKHSYTTVTAENEIEELVSYMMRQRQICFDTETTSLDPYAAKLVGVSLAVEPHTAYWIPANHQSIELLKPLLENPEIDKIGQNLKFDIEILRCTHNIDVQGILYDTMIEHYLLKSEERHSMDFLARNYLNYNPISYEDLVGKGAKQITIDRVDPQLVSEYAAEDADITLQLHQKLWQEIEKENLTELYHKIEEPLIRCLVTTELKGVKIDIHTLGYSAKELNREMLRLESEIREIAETPYLNINSPKQLGEILYEKLKVIDNPKLTKTKQYKTDEESLQQIADKHPIVGKILEYRGIKKLLSTYIEALPKLINPRTGRIHTSFNQAVTSTGRLSSTNPNLQNIPIRDAAGREIRKAFVAEKGSVLISADYSQVELRIMAHLSQDPALIEAFKNGEDIHTTTAAKIYNVAAEDVTKEQRRRAKTANFGIIYGISVFGLSQRLNIPRGEAKELIDGYFSLYPGVRRYMEECKIEARERGFVETIFARRRYLPEITSKNAVMRSYAERNAINAPIQGSAADIMKLAMIEVAAAIAPLSATIVLQVHDELVVECPAAQAAQVMEIMREKMMNCTKILVPLAVDAAAAEDWLAAH
ncbi:DNA polymerase I [Mucinivorans hirudinis]|uniref:DNA polymerase I n=1 Tax=Mucinivorans hirudinis TaxID=1433126 RepID=A0A060R722_9BACT|nr:DNA polymerase I [Mucinivorans hirudinis]